MVGLLGVLEGVVEEPDQGLMLDDDGGPLPLHSSHPETVSLAGEGDVRVLGAVLDESAIQGSHEAATPLVEVEVEVETSDQSDQPLGSPDDTKGNQTHEPVLV